MTGTFTSLNGTTYTVQIGSAEGTMTLAADPVHISWSRGEHFYSPLRTKECSIRIITSEDMSYLYTADPMGVQVSVLADGATIFFGYLIPQTWDAPNTGFLDEIEVAAVDALAVLKHIKYQRAGAYSDLLSSSYFVSKACQLCGLADGVTGLMFGSTLINEDSFLPAHHDVDPRSSERMTWADVLEAIGYFNRVVFCAQGGALSALRLDFAQPITKDLRAISRGVDMRKSIEPAKSYIKVNYDTTAKSYSLDLNENRVEEGRYMYTTFTPSSSTSGAKPTEAVYYVSKDWQSKDSRAACVAHIFSGLDTYNGFADEMYCVVGPAKLRYAAMPRVTEQSQLKISMDIHGSSSMGSSGPYKILDVYSKKSDIKREDIEITVTIGSTVTTFPGNHTMRDEPALDYGFQTYTRHFRNASGLIDIDIPEGIVVSNIRIEQQNYIVDFVTKEKTSIGTLPNDGVVNIADGYDDGLTIDAKLRLSSWPYAKGDVYGMFATNYPFVTPEQFAEPRSRFTTEVDLWSTSVNALTCISDSNLSTHKMFCEAGDMDLRNDRMTLTLIESYT